MELETKVNSDYFILKPKRWFLFSVAALLGVLIGSLLLAALILLQDGKRARRALVIGNSMEPTLSGPGKPWSCEHCSTQFRFARESINANQPLICPFCRQVNSLPTYELLLEKVEEAERLEPVEYHIRSYVAARRKKAGVSTVSRGLKRGDLIVFNAPDLDRREIKRVVGFPGEKIEVKDGDLWIDGERWKKSLSTLLDQAILIADSRQRSTPELAWAKGSEEAAQQILLKSPEDQTPSDNNTDPIKSKMHSTDNLCLLDLSHNQYRIDNRLVSNLHDSHQLTEVQDIGIALQLGATSDAWSLTIDLATSSGPMSVTLSHNEHTWVGAFHNQKQHSAVPIQDNSTFASWLVAVIADGDILIGLNDKELFRWNLPGSQPGPLATTSDTDLANKVINIQCTVGYVETTDRLVFRDIHYRGTSDSEYQLFQENGLVLLGDNVSLSFDSRNRWPEGIPEERAIGIVQLPQTGIEHLLRQRELLPKEPSSHQPTRQLEQVTDFD